MITFLLIGDDFPAAQTLQFLLKNEKARVTAVYTSFSRGADARLQIIAQKAGIPLNDSDLLKNPIWKSSCARTLFDWIININSTVILPSEVLSLAHAGAINMHPGRLPEYAGLHTHQWALRNGEETFAITVHFMEAGVDTGDIILWREFDISPLDTGLTLYHKCMREGIKGLSEVLTLILEGQDLPRMRQDLSRYRLYRHKDALDGRIDWTRSAVEIERFIRAGNYAPLTSPTYTAMLDAVPREGREDFPQVLSAEVMEELEGAYPAATVLHRCAGADVVVVCGDGRGLRLNQVRWASDRHPITLNQLMGWLPHGSQQRGRSG